MADITGIGSVFDFAGKIIDRVWPDPTQAAQAKLDLFKAEQAGELGELKSAWDNASAQIEVNKVEAANESVFVSGWRPAIGWTCGFALAYSYIIAPFLAYAMAIFGHVVPLPAVDLGQMMPVLFGLLGLGAMRTYEKVKGVNPGSGTPGAGS